MHEMKKILAACAVFATMALTGCNNNPEDVPSAPEKPLSPEQQKEKIEKSNLSQEQKAAIEKSMREVSPTKPK